MDTSILENIAELKIAHELQKHGILVAKPFFDQNGTDLLAFMKMNDGVKFCRIQCKGRSLPKGKSSNISIPQSYVSNGFIVFLYLDFGDYKDGLYIFYTTEIKSWTLNENKEYVLSLTNSNVKDKLKKYILSYSRISMIKNLIQIEELMPEFNKIVQIETA